MSLCRGRAAEYEYANVAGGQWRTKREAAEQLCAGCPVMAQCAHIALKHHALGMVWAGVPIPPEHDSPHVVKARMELIERALHHG